MFSVFCSDARQAGRICDTFPPGTDVRCTDDWGAFARSARESECVVLVCDRLTDEATFLALADLRSRLPLEPLVLVTHRQADNARCLKDLRFEEVVWPDQIAVALWPAVRRAKTHGCLERLARRFEQAHHLSLPHRAILIAACRRHPPARAVHELAESMACDRRTLWRHWSQEHPSPSLRLEDFVHWLLLVHAVGRKSAAGWAAVAGELGVHPHTLGRLAHRLVGVSLRDLGIGAQASILARFSQEVLVPLLGPGEWDILG